MTKPSIATVRNIALGFTATAYAILWLGGLGQHAFRGSKHDGAAVVFLVVAGSLIVLDSPSLVYLRTLGLVGVLGFVFELVGVRYGIPFGAYSYTSVLQPQWMGVPIVMAWSWLILAAYVFQMLRHLNWPKWATAVLGAAWMTGIDLLIDPLATNQLHYWDWKVRGVYFGVPATNFAGWFVTSAVILLCGSRLKARNRWSGFVGLSIILFFTLSALLLQVYLVGLVGFALCVTHVLVSRFRRAYFRSQRYVD